MSGRPGYEELVAKRGRLVADEIFAGAELHSDSAHKDWDTALAWAIEQYDRPDDPALVAQQNENARLYNDLMQRRSGEARRILYLATELGGDAYDHPDRLVQAEAIYDAEGWRLPAGAGMKEELEWAKARAGALVDVRNRYFEEWSVGEVFETDSHEMTVDRMLSFAEEFDPQPFHVDPDAAAESIYGGLIASGWHTGSVLMRLLTTVLGPSSMGSPGVDKLRWLAPVRAGDQLRVRLTVLDTRTSESKPDRGIIRFKQEMFNQRHEMVMSLEATLFMKRRGR
jgi:acyl dehydratase